MSLFRREKEKRRKENLIFLLAGWHSLFVSTKIVCEVTLLWIPMLGLFRERWFFSFQLWGSKKAQRIKNKDLLPIFNGLVKTLTKAPTQESSMYSTAGSEAKLPSDCQIGFQPARRWQTFPKYQTAGWKCFWPLNGPIKQPLSYTASSSNTWSGYRPLANFLFVGLLPPKRIQNQGKRHIIHI